MTDTPASPTYDQLLATAKAHVYSCNPQTRGSNDPNPETIRSLFDPDARTGFGHAYFVSTAPHLQGDKSREGFISHLCGMGSKLQTWHLEPCDIAIDVRKRTATVRVEARMKAPGADEVLNEVVYWIVMDESGEKVVSLTEYLDPMATKELMLRVQASMQTKE
jgi:hypothetical protein